jgi:two-component sensor histidine kinase
VTSYDTSAASGLDLERSASLVLDVSISAILDDRGKVTNAIIQHNDITERVRASESLKKALLENQTLLSELQHRAKNSFNMILGMIGISSGAAASPGAKAALDGLATRVGAVSELYSLLYSSGAFAEVRLDEYCARIACPLVELKEGIALEMALEPLSLPPKEAAPVGLILTELITNAVKYAFPEGRRGIIRVSLRRAGAGGLLEVRDDGVGLPPGLDPARDGGMGLNLIRGLADQIGGSLDMRGEAAGTSCALEFPLAPRTGS